MVSGRGAHRSEEQPDPSVGANRQPAGGTKGPRFRLRLFVWRGLRVGGQSGGADHYKTVLVVDDDPLVLDYATNVLQDCGYTVLAASNGPAALMLLRDHALIDLLFTDVVMPGLDGVELARRALQQSPGLKVLFTSGYAADVIPAGRLLKKPYRPRQLTGEVSEMLGD